MAPIPALVVDRFDLGFILKHPNGRLGQRRVPEMSVTTAALDRAGGSAGLGVELNVYIVKEWQNIYLFSEFSNDERQERERFRQLAIEARSRVRIGQRLTVTVLQKGDWGGICCDANGLLEGFILSELALAREGWPEPELERASREVAQLAVGSSIEVVVARKDCSFDRGNILYFGVLDSRVCEQSGAPNA